jgi:hypothetical protein
MSDIRNFERQFAASTKTVIEASNKAIRKGSEELLKSIVQSTPVQSGQLRANWKVSLDNPTDEVSRGRTDVSGFSTVASGRAVLSSFSLERRTERTIYLNNNLEYASRIEFGGHSQQAPFGMVRLNVARFNYIMSKAGKA